MDGIIKIILLGMLSIMYACTTVQEIDIGLDPPKLVLNSLFTQDSTWNISLSETVNVKNSGTGQHLHFLPNVSVSIYGEENLLVEVLKPIGWFEYKGQTKPLPGMIYKVIVALDRGGEIQATNLIPDIVPISSYQIDSTLFISKGGDIQMTVSFKDPPGQKNFYLIKILRNAYSLNNNDTIRYFGDIPYKPIDPLYQSNFANGVGTLLNDNLFNGKEYDFLFNLNPNFNSGTTEKLRIALLSVTEEYYQYFMTKSLQDKTIGDPFAQPTQIFTNVENGLGIFAGYSISVVTLD